eukprot:6199684-Pleurochrysis_carterae.AAC.1
MPFKNVNTQSLGTLACMLHDASHARRSRWMWATHANAQAKKLGSRGDGFKGEMLNGCTGLNLRVC